MSAVKNAEPFNFSHTASAALGGGTRLVSEPATGETLWSVNLATPADVAAAAQAAEQAQARWVQVPPREKAEILRRAGELFSQRHDELSLHVARETGGILPKGQHEIREAAVLCHLAASMPLQSQGQVLPSTPGRMSLARRVPRGVVGVISPFNFPMILTLRAVAPALAAPW